MTQTVNWIRAPLKVTAGFISAADGVNINQTTKAKDKIIYCSWLKDFCSFNKKQRKFTYYSEDYPVFSCIWFFMAVNWIL